MDALLAHNGRTLQGPRVQTSNIREAAAAAAQPKSHRLRQRIKHVVSNEKSEKQQTSAHYSAPLLTLTFLLTVSTLANHIPFRYLGVHVMYWGIPYMQLGYFTVIDPKA
jgi:hypothetical protein